MVFAAYSKVDNRTGVGGPGGSEHDGYAGVMHKGAIAQLTCSGDLLSTVGDDRPFPEPPELPHCHASDPNIPMHYS